MSYTSYDEIAKVFRLPHGGDVDYLTNGEYGGFIKYMPRGNKKRGNGLLVIEHKSPGDRFNPGQWNMYQEWLMYYTAPMRIYYVEYDPIIIKACSDTIIPMVLVPKQFVNRPVWQHKSVRLISEEMHGFLYGDNSYG
jgi:hypothetical protein